MRWLTVSTLPSCNNCWIVTVRLPLNFFVRFSHLDPKICYNHAQVNKDWNNGHIEWYLAKSVFCLHASVWLLSRKIKGKTLTAAGTPDLSVGDSPHPSIFFFSILCSIPHSLSSLSFPTFIFSPWTYPTYIQKCLIASLYPPSFLCNWQCTTTF